jgi:electron transport complex protein RnfG
MDYDQTAGREKGMMKNYIAPILALSLICLVMAGALALVNNVTYPVIAEAAAERADQARRDIIPAAENFILIENDGFTSTILYAHRAVNRAGDMLGFTFIVSTKGFGGEMRIICGINPNGQIISSSILADSETISFVQRVAERSNELEHGGGSLLDIDAISNATVTFNAYRRALEDAMRAFQLVGNGLARSVGGAN